MELEHIAGIGPALARRLGDSGITTVADLADATPTQVAGAAHGTIGMNEARAARWIADARRLRGSTGQDPPAAEGVARAGPPPEETVSIVPDAAPTFAAMRTAATAAPRHETFSLRLELDADRAVQHVIATHVRTGVDQRSNGWSAGWFESVMRSTADVRFAADEVQEADRPVGGDMTVPSEGERQEQPPAAPDPAVRFSTTASPIVAIAAAVRHPAEVPTHRPARPPVAGPLGYLAGGRSWAVHLPIDRSVLAPEASDGDIVRIDCRPFGGGPSTTLRGTLSLASEPAHISVDTSDLQHSVYRVVVLDPLSNESMVSVMTSR